MSPIIWIIVAVLGRIIPHPANFTPLTNMCLFAGSKLPRAFALAITLLSIAISDVILAQINGYPIFSAWSLFTYSGFAGIVLLGSSLANKNSTKTMLVYVLSSGLGFWVWTNFGVWLTSSLYIKNISGLISCYIAALPFLRNALCGDLVWFVVMFGTFKLVEKRQPATRTV